MEEKIPNITDERFCIKCKWCCIFKEKERDLAPYFSKSEAKSIDKRKIEETDGGFLQAKTLKSRSRKGYKCIFLKEKQNICSIYKNRPMDCKTWPFVVGWDEEKKDVYLWIVNKEFCRAVKNVKKIKKSEIAENLIDYLKNNNFFSEIKNKNRYIWPYRNYQIKLKKITNLIK